MKIVKSYQDRDLKIPLALILNYIELLSMHHFNNFKVIYRIKKIKGIKVINLRGINAKIKINSIRKMWPRLRTSILVILIVVTSTFSYQ